jgi:hypothetical protein
VYNAAITDEGKLYTWLQDQDYSKRDWYQRDTPGLGYPLHDLGDDESDIVRPRCVAARAGMRIVSVAVGSLSAYTIVATDEGVAWRLPESAPATSVLPVLIQPCLRYN